MKTDHEIKKNVLDQLMWQPEIDETKIGVIVENGVVTLTGVVDSYTKKLAVEKAVKSIIGVKAIVLDIEVKYAKEFIKTDAVIAKSVINTLAWNGIVPEENISVKVENGLVYLSGEVQWFYQKDAAKKAVENLLGVKGVINKIQVKQKGRPTQITQKIRKAFERSADVDDKNITLLVENDYVKLTGSVRTFLEKEATEKIAYFTPGVTNVKNELRVEYEPIYV
ncbi:MAG: BON domain-containing protein [Lutibacter sp.]|nr:BON domain-containing protein [Lutibacter sp.]MDT8417410.1 BON domain-containing protein [Lutibacter sp.]